MSDTDNTNTTHLVLISNSAMPVYCNSLKEATDYAEDKVKADPTNVSAKVFQLRTEIKANVEIDRKDFLGASLV